jgi:TonB family protein
MAGINTYINRIEHYIRLRPQLGWSAFSFFFILALLVLIRWSGSGDASLNEEYKFFDMVELKLSGAKTPGEIQVADDKSEASVEKAPEEPMEFGDDSGEFNDPGDSIRPPKPLFSRLPKYPDSMRKEGIEGLVVIEIGIDTDGSVVFGKIVQSLGREFDKAVLAWARGIRFYPAKNPSREPVKCRIRLPIRFRLEG